MTPLPAAYEDDDLLIVDKPQGLATASGKSPSLCDLVFAARPELAAVGGHRRGEGGLLNRLDNETGGLVLFAKTREAFDFYAGAMRNGRIVKTYLAAVRGRPDAPAGTIALPIAHAATSARRMLVADGRAAVRGRGRPALTSWRLLESRPPYALLEITIARGVRHQIRVHLAALGLPVVGDKLYDKKGSAGLVPHHLLSCRSVRFPARGGGERSASADVPFLEWWRGLPSAAG